MVFSSPIVALLFNVTQGESRQCWSPYYYQQNSHLAYGPYSNETSGLLIRSHCKRDCRDIFLSNCCPLFFVNLAKTAAALLESQVVLPKNWVNCGCAPCKRVCSYLSLRLFPFFFYIGKGGNDDVGVFNPSNTPISPVTLISTVWVECGSAPT